MSEKAIIMNMSEVVLPVMEAYGRADKAALQLLASTIAPVNPDIVTDAYPNGYKRGWDIKTTEDRLLQELADVKKNNTFMPIDWMYHLPSVKAFVSEKTGLEAPSPDDMQPFLSKIELRYAQVLEMNLHVFEDADTFLSSARNAGYTLILDQDIKAHYASQMLNAIKLSNGSKLVDSFDHVFSPEPSNVNLPVTGDAVDYTSIHMVGSDQKKPSTAHIELIEKITGISQDNWIVIGEKPDKDGGLIYRNGKRNGSGIFIQIKRDTKPEHEIHGTAFLKSLSDYQDRKQKDLNKAGIKTPIKPDIMINSFDNDQLFAALRLNKSPIDPYPAL